MENMECIKEFKVRMDQIKCEKYKTFQSELPTKKFIFSDERESIHHLKLLRDDCSDQNKATAVHGEPTEEISSGSTIVKPEEVEEEVRKTMFGTFRDNVRRIDLVLVVEEDVNELMNNIKIDFLSYIVRSGLEVEIEPGMMKKHKNLTFIKVHAPDSVLEKYGKFFGTKRYFADTRYDDKEMMKEKKTKNFDKEWVMFVRNNYKTPNGYSNYERSIIVYKILLHLSFGDNANYYGIERLLNHKVIVDVFALHDGPYFITPDQTISELNARQILNYYWSRTQNLFKHQPIHLIHEYFGPRIAFYFAFYEFFTKALKVAAFLGVLNIILGTLNLTDSEKGLKDEICNSDKKICPFCKNATICPERVCKDYCLSMQIHLIFDHAYIPLYSTFTVVGAFIFLRLWQRREYFLKWTWEVGRHDSYYKNALRPLFNIGGCVRTDPFIGGLKYSESILPIFMRNVIAKAIVLLYWYIIVPVMLKTYDLYVVFCKEMIVKEKYEKYRDYIVMFMFQTFYTLLITGMEKIYHYIVYFLAKCENHSSHKKFEESIVIKKVGFKMVFQYAFIAYYAWIHGQHPRYTTCKNDVTFHNSLRHLLYRVYGYKAEDICDRKTFCFPYSCIIEVATLLSTLLVVTQVVYKLSHYIFSLTTDYNRSTYSNSDVPCWEREYRLSSVTELDMIKKYVNLASQFALVTWFVIAVPFAAPIIYLINVWDLRHEARKLLLASRRPLFIKTSGTKMNKVFYFIAFISVLTNAITIATVTRAVIRYIYGLNEKKKIELFDDRHYYYRQLYCFSPDAIKKVTTRIVNVRNVKTKKNYKKYYYMTLKTIDTYVVNIYSTFYFLAFVFAMCFVFIILRYIIPRQREVEKTRVIEEKVRNLYCHYEYKYKDLKDI